MEGAMSCVKYLIFIFNFLFWISGLAIIVVGSLIYVHIDKYGAVLNENFAAGVILLIVVGCIVTLIAFFGCCGACKESYCMTMTFAVLLGIIFVLELAAGITCYVYRGEIDRIAFEEFENAWESYDKSPEVAKTIDLIQHDLQCCGVNGSSDWATLWKQPGYPDSCCIKSTQDCGKTARANEVFKDGCYINVKSALESDILIIAGVGVGVAFIQLIGVAFACCLARAINKNYEVV